MEAIIKMFANIVNDLHDYIIAFFNRLGFAMTDKELHFWVLGIFGFLLFIFTQLLFKYIAKWSISVISFIYTITVLLVVVFAIEIQQKITGRGNMEFIDAVEGIRGFLAFFSIYLAYKLIKFAVIKVYNNIKKSKDESDSSRMSKFH